VPGQQEVFIEELMAYILSLRRVPKVQVERVIGPILGLFIEDLLSTMWGNPADKPVKMISEEFPLRKDVVKNDTRTCQSTNIDWLLYDFVNDQLVFLELKTACTGFDIRQACTYCRTAKKIEVEPEGASFLESDVEAIKDASNNGSPEKQKYEVVLNRFQSNPDYKSCKKAKVVYLAPAAMAENVQHKLPDCRIKWLSFAELPATLTRKFPEEWKIIYGKLLELDSNPPRNGACDGGDRRNYEGTCRLKEVMERCKEDGDRIVIGFAGGVGKLHSSSLDELKKRRAFKWDYADNGSRVKDTTNWISGREFLEIVETLIYD
jgi:hypothetical protein